MLSILCFQYCSAKVLRCCEIIYIKDYYFCLFFSLLTTSSTKYTRICFRQTALRWNVRGKMWQENNRKGKKEETLGMNNINLWRDASRNNFQAHGLTGPWKVCWSVLCNLTLISLKNDKPFEQKLIITSPPPTCWG